MLVIATVLILLMPVNFFLCLMVSFFCMKRGHWGVLNTAIPQKITKYCNTSISSGNAMSYQNHYSVC